MRQCAGDGALCCGKTADHVTGRQVGPRSKEMSVPLFRQMPPAETRGIWQRRGELAAAASYELKTGFMHGSAGVNGRNPGPTDCWATFAPRPELTLHAPKLSFG